MIGSLLLAVLGCYVFTVSQSHATGTKWAVLVAGSSRWVNYRHQSAVSHAYQVLIKKGIKQDHIVTMMYDDIAYNKRNPFPGQLFTDYGHEDRYKGVKIDYKGRDVTAYNFIRIMKADKKLKREGRKVLESGPEDDVFIFFSDHGTTNMICFPNDNLYSHNLNDTLTWMYENKRYKHVLLYIEACESGSMFADVLSDQINVFATTSSNPSESGHACFCEDPKIDVCLGDEYSVAWTADSEQHDITKRTLWEQFLATKAGTKLSEVCQYGSESMHTLEVGDFQGNTKPKSIKPIQIEHRQRSRQTHFLGKQRRFLEASNEVEFELAQFELAHTLERGEMVAKTFEYLTKVAEYKKTSNSIGRDKRETIECFRVIYEAYAKHCFRIQEVPEVAEHLHKFDRFCAEGINPIDMVDAIENICQ